MRNRTASLLCCLALVAGAAFAAGPPQDRAPRASRIPVIHDGVLFAPGEFKRPEGRITWVLTREDVENGTIHAFTSPEVAAVFMNRELEREFGPTHGQEKTSHTPHCPIYPFEYSYFNKDIGCGGSAHLYMYPGQEYPHLSFDGWNNRISCVKSACIWAWTVLYACRYFETSIELDCANPDDLYIGPGQVITDLSYYTYDFNNRTSSIRFCTTNPCS